MAFKTILLASALAFGGTAIAQNTMTTPLADPAAQSQPMTTPPTNPATPPPTAPMTSPAPMQPGTPMQSTVMTAPDGFQGRETQGGYEPANPPMMGMAQPGVTPVFVPAPPVSQAYPAPAPLESYPICKKGQTDKCRQRGG